MITATPSMVTYARTIIDDVITDDVIAVTSNFTRTIMDDVTIDDPIAVVSVFDREMVDTTTTSDMQHHQSSLVEH